MTLEPLIPSNEGLTNHGRQPPGAEANSMEPHLGEWSGGCVSGSDQELHRSQVAVALNELLHEHGLNNVGVDGLLLRDEGWCPAGQEEAAALLANSGELAVNRSLIVIDQGVADWRHLLVDAPQDAEVLLLNRDECGVEQISDFLLQERLNGARAFSTLAIVSEGSEGRLLIGGGELSATQLSRHAQQLRAWGDALSPGADLMLYGCNVAAGSTGKSFIQQLATVIGCDVAASNDLTGNTSLGGDLELEEHVGTVGSGVQWLEQAVSEQLGHLLDAGKSTHDQLRWVRRETEPDLPLQAIARLETALSRANEILTAISNRDDGRELLRHAFLTTGANSETWEKNASTVEKKLASEGLNLEVEVENGGNMREALGAYTRASTDSELGHILLNADWIATGASEQDLVDVLLEESGHALDQLLNPLSDSTGDEGERFRLLLKDIPLTDWRYIAAREDDDHITLSIDGAPIQAEAAITLSGSGRGLVSGSDYYQWLADPATTPIASQDAKRVEANGALYAPSQATALSPLNDNRPTLFIKYTTDSNSNISANNAYIYAYQRVNGNWTILDGDATAPGNNPIISATGLPASTTGFLKLESPIALADGEWGFRLLTAATTTSSTPLYSGWFIDTTPPTVTVSSNSSNLRAGEDATITFNFSEDPVGFEINDINVTGGTINNLSTYDANNKSYTATFTPSTDTTTNATVSVASGKFRDAAGNYNQDSNSNTAAINVDTQRPTVSISSNATSLKSGEVATITFGFSEAPTGFDKSDISVTGGTLSDLSTYDSTNRSYVATYTPATDSNAVITLSVSNDSFTDLAGNTNQDGSDSNNTLGITIDTKAPTFTSSNPGNGSTSIAADSNITLVFSENITRSSDGTNKRVWIANNSDPSDTRVIDIGDNNQITISGNTLTVTPSIHLASNSSYSVKIDSGAILDGAGNIFEGIDSANTLTFQTATYGGTLHKLPTDPLITEEDTPLTGLGINVDYQAVNAGGASEINLSVVHGTLSVSGALKEGYSNHSATIRLFGTEAEINNALASLTYSPSANFNGNDTLRLQSYNSSTNTPITGVNTLNISVIAVNDAPGSGGAAVVAMAAVSANQVDPAGSSIATLFASRFNDSTDAVSGGSSANSLAGIFITANAASNSQGTWQWKSDLSWNNIPATVSSTNALFLSSNTSLRFLPANGSSGSAGSLSLRLVDSSTLLSNGTAGVNLSVVGGTSAISSDLISLTTTVTENLAPTAPSLIPQIFTAGLADSYIIPAFEDPEGESLQYSAALVDANGNTNALPDWLRFNANTRVMLGTPPVGVAGTSLIRITATDEQGISNSADFTISTATTVGAGTAKIAQLSTAYELIDAPLFNANASNTYELETQEFRIASKPISGSHFSFYQSGGPSSGFAGYNVSGILRFIDTAGHRQEIAGVASRPVQSGNQLSGLYFFADKTTNSTAADKAYLLAIDGNAFSAGCSYQTTTERVDKALNNWLTLPELRISSAVASESSGSISFTIERSGNINQECSVLAYTAIGVADSASAQDFSAKAEMITLAAGSSSATFNVQLRNDSRFEADEFFSVRLTDAINARITRGEASGRIQSDDTAADFGIQSSGTVEGGLMNFSIERTGDTSRIQSVSWRTIPSGSASVEDFTAAAGILTFSPGESRKTISVLTTTDTLPEAVETFGVLLYNPTNGAGISNRSATGSIEDDEAVCIYSVADTTVNESDGSLTFTISRSKTLTAPQSVSYSVTSVGTTPANLAATANPGIDAYGALSGNLIFAPSELSKTVSLTISDDGIFEQNEKLRLQLYGLTTPPDSAETTISSYSGAATATIVDNDQAYFSISDSSGIESGTIVFNVTLSTPTDRPVSVDYTTSLRATDSATPADFTPISGTLVFAAGVTTQQITISLNDDSVAESNECFGLTLSNPTQGVLIDGKGEGTGWINDNDLPTFRVSNPVVKEGGYAEFSVSLNAISNQPINFNARLVSITATAGSSTTGDYNNSLEVWSGNGWIAFNQSAPYTLSPGNTTVRFRAKTNADSEPEGAETFRLLIDNITPGRARLGDAVGVATITEASYTTQEDGEVVLDQIHSTLAGATFRITSAIPGLSLDTSTGSWLFDPSDSAYQYLNLATGTLLNTTIVINWTATADSNSESGSFTIQITGTNDTPVFISPVSPEYIFYENSMPDATSTSLFAEHEFEFRDVDNLAMRASSSLISSTWYSLNQNGWTGTVLANRISEILANSWSGGTLTNDIVDILGQGFINWTGATDTRTTTSLGDPTSVVWRYDVPDVNLEFLRSTDRISLVYDVAISDIPNDVPSDKRTVTITIQGTDDAPNANPDMLTVAEDSGSTSFSLITNDSDPEGETITVSSITIDGQSFSIPGNGRTIAIDGQGSISINPDGSGTFTPFANFNGIVKPIFYTIRDASNQSDSGSISSLTITVTPINDAPLIAGLAGGDYTIKGPPIFIISESGITDADALGNSFNFNNGMIRVSLDAYKPGDLLSINNQGNNTGEIAISGGSIYYSGTIFGTVSGGNGTDLIVSLNEHATPLAAQALLNQLQFSSSSSDPTLGGNAPTRVLSISLNDGANLGSGGAKTGTVSGIIRINPVNDPPTLSLKPLNPPFLEAPGLGSLTNPVALFANANINSADAPQSITGLSLSITGLRDGGNEQLIVDGTVISLGSNTTAQSITANNGLAYSVAINNNSATINLQQSAGVSATEMNALINNILYQNTKTDDPTAGPRTLTITQLVDSGSNLFPNVNLSVLDMASTVTVIPINDAPIPLRSVTNLPTVNEDSLDPPGDTVASLYSTVFSDPESGDSLAGIAIFSYTEETSRGIWQYSTNGGSNWLNLSPTSGAPSISETSAIALKPTDRLRFLPTANWSSLENCPPLSTRLIDSTKSVTSGERLDITNNGGSSPFSAATITITTGVTPVSDAPSGTDNTVTLLEDGTKIFAASDFGFSDPTDSGSDIDTLTAVRIASLPLNGTLKYNGTAITQAQIDAGFDVNSADLNTGKLTFSPLPNAYGSGYASFSFQVIDSGSTDNSGVIIDPSPNTITINVTPVNDAPTLDLNGVQSGTSYYTAFGSGSNGVAITGSDTSIIDVDDLNIESASITLVNPSTGDLLQAGTLPAGISIAKSDETSINLVGSASKADYQQALRAIRFNSNQPIPYGETRIISISVNDGDANSNESISFLQVITVATLTAQDTRAVEGNKLEFTAILSAASTSSAISIPLSIQGSSTATSSLDYSNKPTFSDGVTYNQATGMVNIPAGVSSFKIIFQTLDDLNVEGTETVNIQLGSAIASGQITDGAGTYLKINSITVNEASPTAVFRVDGVEGQQIKLSLEAFDSDNEALQARPDAGARAATLTGSLADIGTKLQIFDGQGWQPYVAGSYVSYPTGSTTLLVRMAVVNDQPYEGPEAFKLIAEGKAIDSKVSNDEFIIRIAGIGVIADDARGAIYNEAGAEVQNARKDDDRPVKISSININEGSDYGVFTVVNGEPSDITLDLSLTNPDQLSSIAGEKSFDMGQAFEIWTGSNWAPYAGSVDIRKSGLLYVRVNTKSEQDDVFEGRVGASSQGETFRLTATWNGNTSFGIGQILDDGTGLRYSGEIDKNGPITFSTDLDDDLDKDGIAPNVEEILATLSASSGGGGAVGDLNNDGIQDAIQQAVATLAWIKADYFDKANAGELTIIRPIINLSVRTSTDPSAAQTAGLADTLYQLQNIKVIPPSDPLFGSLPTDARIKAPNGLSATAVQTKIEAPWDPIRFAVAKQPNQAMLVDADPSRDGVQIVISIDISRSGVKEGDFNGYLKYVRQRAIDDANPPLRDLDGQLIKTEGWYDFLQRKDSQGNYFGDGARFITKNGFITTIQLTFTDNAMGDNNVTAEGIEDPGLPVKISQAFTETVTTGDPVEETTTSPDEATRSLPIIDISPTEQRARNTEGLSEITITSQIQGTVFNTISDPYVRGSGGSEKSLVEALSLAAQSEIDTWAMTNGLNRNSVTDEPSNRQAGTSMPDDRGVREKPLAFVSEAMGLKPSIGGNLFEALVLGGASLYALDRFSGGNFSNWIRQLLPKAPGNVLAGAWYERVVVVFLLESEFGLPRLIAAEVNDDRLEILAEEVLPMSLSAASNPGHADLDDQFQKLVKKVTDRAKSEHDLLLFDPKIREDLPIYKKLGRDNDQLKPHTLKEILGSLTSEEVEDLRHWISRPSSSDLVDHPLSKRLSERQRQLKAKINEQKARLVSMLELSLAMSLRVS